MARPMKLAVIGGGPSAFYVSSRLLSLTSSPDLRIHMFDRLWAPHGLVRYGVAPDHPEVKNCTHKFDQTALNSRFKFFGNVNVGKQFPSRKVDHALHLPLSSLFSHYTHVLFATGCTRPIPHPSLPFSRNCIPALDLVHWYTQHPSLPQNWEPPLDSSTKRVSIIGAGNVALDIARILLMDPEHLKVYDVPEKVLDVLRKSSVKHVDVFARRGPLGAAFTNKELREMMELPGTSMKPIPKDILSSLEGEKLTRQQKRAFDILKKGSKEPHGSTSKSWSLSFFRSPLSFKQGQLQMSHTTVDASTGKAITLDTTSTYPTDLVIPAIGFQAEPLQDYDFFDVKCGHLRTKCGRMVSPAGHTIKNVYSSGWAASGPKGVLASTMMDAYAVADTILNDWMETAPEITTSTTFTPESPPLLDVSTEQVPLLSSSSIDPKEMEKVPEEVEQGLKNRMVVSYDDWRKVDQEEVQRGEVIGKERERMSWEEAKMFLNS